MTVSYYDEKIKEVYKNIGRVGEEFLNQLQEIEDINNKPEGGLCKISQDQLKSLINLINTIKEESREFDHLTQFYPNKDAKWSTEISNVKELLNYILQIKLEEATIE